MKIEDFDFATKQVSKMQVECTLINRETKNKYGIIIRGNGIPPNEWIFDRFIEDRKMQRFFVDIEAEKIYDEVIVEKKEIIIEELKKVEEKVDKQETLV